MLLKYKKTNITFFISFYLFLVILLFSFSFKFFITSFEKIEDTSNKNKVITILNTINNNIENLKMNTSDYSNWDDTYEFIRDENKEYIETNFREGTHTLEELNLDVMIFHNIDDKVIFSKYVNSFLEENKNDFEKLIIKKFKNTNKLGTIVNYKSKLLYVSKNEILKSDSTGEVKGFVTTIKELDIEDFSEENTIFKKIELSENKSHKYQLSLNFGAIGDVKVYIIKENEIINNIQFFDEKENYIISIIAYSERKIVNNGKTTIYIYNFIVAIALLFVFYFIYRNQYLIENQNQILNKEIARRTRQLDKAFRKLKDKNKELYTLANIDTLTKIKNRRSFFINSEEVLEVAIRKNKPLCVLLMDIDYFKSINDTYGHAVGDKVLVEFCTIVTSIIDDKAIFGRIGGEEFCITFFNKSLDEVNEISEQIRQKCENNLIIIDNSELKFTVSMGLSCREEHTDIDAILHASDELLYEAKKTGRNRIIRSSR